MRGSEVEEDKIKEWSQKLEVIYQRVKTNKITFLNSNQFSKLMKVFSRDISQMSAERDLIRHHNDLILELKRFALQSKASQSGPKIKNKIKKVNNLTTTLQQLLKEIKEAENQVLDLNSMEGKTSFTHLPKLYRKAYEVWVKREEMLNRSTVTGRNIFKKFKYDSTTYPEINKCVEQILTNHLKKMKSKETKGYVDESFTFIDVRKAILKEIEDKGLAVMGSEALIENIYKDLIRELRERREKDKEEAFETFITLDDLKPETFVETDPELELELAKNKKSGQQRMQDVFDKYAKEDRQKNCEKILTKGRPEWDSYLVNNNEEFESLDVKDGDLEADDEEVSDEEEEEEVESVSAPLSDFSEVKTEDKPTPTVINSESEPIAVNTNADPIVVTATSEPITNGCDESDDDSVQILD